MTAGGRRASTTTSDDGGRRAQLRPVKLLALIGDHLGVSPVEAATGIFPPGAAAVAGDTAWVLVEDDPGRGLGPALAWAIRHGASRLQLLAERDTGLLARRAAGFTVPIEVWHVDERTLLPAVAEPPIPPPPASAQHLALLPAIEAGGAVPNVEHGVVTGEVRGLEVCRVVDDTATGAVRLEVGVGAHDREAFTIMHGDVPTVEALAGVVAAVAAHRRPDAPQHPLNRLAPERLLRWRLQQDPALIGLVSLVPTPPPVPRPSIKDRAPCSARGRRPDGSPALVVCSSGGDLDVIPYAIDARRHEPGADEEVMVVAEERDLLPITADLATLAAQPLSLVAVRAAHPA
ncbi:MAG: hypothetical protein ACRDZ2_10605 [Ilumatobacteraceae bacterium]